MSIITKINDLLRFYRMYIEVLKQTKPLALTIKCHIHFRNFKMLGSNITTMQITTYHMILILFILFNNSSLWIFKFFI